MNQDEALRVAGHLLERSSCAGAWAVDLSGETCNACDPEACLWCLEGALQVVGARLTGRGARELELAGRVCLGFDPDDVGALIRAWDDEGPHERDAIITKLKAAGTVVEIDSARRKK